MTKKIRNLLILFVVISVVGIGYIAFRYVGADSLIGLGPYVVKVEMTDSGGIFPKASVSYRGVEIGKVGDMRFTPTGLEMDLEIEKDSPDVPASAIAVIANRSAVGEQYVDLEPPRDGGPYLHDGSVITANNVRTPVPVDSLLKDVNQLATSVPLPQLQTTVNELYTAFDRTGPDLQRLLDSSNTLVSTAISQLPQTTQLLRDSRTVLTTQSQLGPQIVSFSRSLDLFTAQLKADDPNLRRLVHAAPPAATQLEGLIRETGPDLSRTLANLLDVVRIVQPRLAGVEQFLVTYPGLSAAAPSVVPGDGRVHFGLVLNIQDPPYCQNGAYLHQAGDGDPQTTWQQANVPPPDPSNPVTGGQPLTNPGHFPMNTTVWCQQTNGQGFNPAIDPRGSQRAPLPNGAKRPQGSLLDPNTAYGPRSLPDPARADSGDTSQPVQGGAAQSQASPAASSSQASSQNANQTTAFSGVSSSPADALANAKRGAPPIVIPGLG
ncbi:MCE family protein [Actinomycetospora sp. TBRC 11914]|uniref:MCE family protein n=1 Tax=Actinomycetospora sp. TBRC 11914 TaxID=2729387 RepID=UPI00145F112B|nr:MCE family protein [Actinomycetospora sp. TBRC 11914]NMO93392.1 MCE family protein [Actinomycetospora sp. TBRC 11914]